MKDMGLQCWEGQHWAAVVIGAAAVLVYAFGIPLLQFGCLFSNRKRLDDPQVQAKWLFLYHSYKNSRYWWEPMRLLQILALTAVKAFGYMLDPVVKVYVLQVMLFVFIFLS